MAIQVTAYLRKLLVAIFWKKSGKGGRVGGWGVTGEKEEKKKKKKKKNKRKKNEWGIAIYI